MSDTTPAQRVTCRLTIERVATERGDDWVKIRWDDLGAGTPTAVEMLGMLAFAMADVQRKITPATPAS